MISGDTQRILERLATQERRLAAQGRELARLRRRRRWWRLPLAGLVLVALALAPLGVLGANFVDLNPGSPHNNDINAIADAGISRGCSDTIHYCPNQSVTREQMASFLARTAGLGGNPPVANALTAVFAGNANTLNGWAAGELVRTTGAGSGTGGITVVNTYQAVTAVSINIPAPGFVYAVGAVNVYAGSGSSSSYIFVRLRDVNSGLTTFPLNGYVGTLAGHTYESSFSPTVVFPAPAGTRTYALDVARDNLSYGNTFARHGVITLIYVPFGGGGAQAAAVDDVQLADEGSLLVPEAPPGERPER